ncbi:MAG: hypothetical protein IKZ41_00515, partial [Clostridia bacterium]|nr:hypothetical protein [Clostridia bacterium]
REDAAARTGRSRRAAKRIPRANRRFMANRPFDDSDFVHVYAPEGELIPGFVGIFIRITLQFARI